MLASLTACTTTTIAPNRPLACSSAIALKDNTSGQVHLPVKLSMLLGHQKVMCKLNNGAYLKCTFLHSRPDAHAAQPVASRWTKWRRSWRTEMPTEQKRYRIHKVLFCSSSSSSVGSRPPYETRLEVTAWSKTFPPSAQAATSAPAIRSEFLFLKTDDVHVYELLCRTLLTVLPPESCSYN